MKLFKRLTILLTLLVITVYSVHSIIGKEQSQQSHPTMTHSLTYKEVPERYAIDPLPDLNIQAESAMLINAVTGDVLFEKNSEQPLAVASMSKIMTELLVLEALDDGVITWEDPIVVSDYAYTISNQPGFA